MSLSAFVEAEDELNVLERRSLIALAIVDATDGQTVRVVEDGHASTDRRLRLGRISYLDHIGCSFRSSGHIQNLEVFPDGSISVLLGADMTVEEPSFL